MRILGDILRKNYGDHIAMKYIDVIDDDMDQFPKIDNYLRKAGMHLPLLAINGKIIRPGTGLNYLEIEEELENMGLKKK